MDLFVSGRMEENTGAGRRPWSTHFLLIWIPTRFNDFSASLTVTG